jgi:helix-turn-helix protein
MGLRFTSRRSDSPWVDAVWTCPSDRVGEMTSVAGTRCGLVFWECAGRPHAGVTGPEGATGTAPVPEGAAFVGVEFAIGTSLRGLPAPSLTGGGVELPDTTRTSFRLAGSRWETPGPDDVEALVAHLVRDGAVVRDPVVGEVVRGGRPEVSERTLERRFRAATGLTRGAVRQIERAREAAHLLAAGKGAADVVTALGYFDQAHLARALRRYVGRTATQLHGGGGGTIGLDLPQPTTS